jgi:hypothetical protein
MEIPAYQQVEFFHRFENARRRAQLWRFWCRLVRKPQTLLPFAPIYARLKNRVGYRRGVQEIPLRQIVGSFDKSHLFDRAFRPLSDDLCRRWVNMKMLQEAGGWEPIDVHQIGNLYFVEDGHHRVAVARDAGLRVIEANVVEYPLSISLDPDAHLEAILHSLRSLNVTAGSAGLPGVCPAETPSFSKKRVTAVTSSPAVS